MKKPHAGNGCISSTATLAESKLRCMLQVRDLPLEFFKHSKDGRKWRSAARTRYALLLRLATNANPDGTFTSPDGDKNFSPSAERLQQHFARRSMYRNMEELRDLGLLDWHRPNHYGRRVYEIRVPIIQEQVPYSQEQVPYSREQVPQLGPASVPPSFDSDGDATSAVAPRPAASAKETRDRRTVEQRNFDNKAHHEKWTGNQVGRQNREEKEAAAYADARVGRFNPDAEVKLLHPDELAELKMRHPDLYEQLYPETPRAKKPPARPATFATQKKSAITG